MVKFNIHLVVLNFQLVVLPNLTKSQLSPTPKLITYLLLSFIYLQIFKKVTLQRSKTNPSYSSGPSLLSSLGSFRQCPKTWHPCHHQQSEDHCDPLGGRFDGRFDIDRNGNKRKAEAWEKLEGS